MSLSKAIGIVKEINEVGNFLQLFGSAIAYLRTRWNNGEQEQQIQEHQGQEQQIQEHQGQEQQIQEHQRQEQQIQEHEVLQLRSDLEILSDTLPSMYNLMDRAEWRSHEKFVAQLLSKLKDVVYDAENLLDEFGWYEIKLLIEGNNSTQLSSLTEFFRSVIQGSFNKVADIQKRLINLSSQLEKMGLREAIPRFDKSVRPVTTSFRTETKIFGREKEIEEVVRLLGVQNSSSRSSSKRKRTCYAANNEPRAASVPVLTIVGMGGVGKTTLAQEITTLQTVKSHFEKTIWICVSNEFDAKRLTKDLIESLSGKEARGGNFDNLQQDLACLVRKKRFLLVLDDIWPDAVDGPSWRKFCAPLKNVYQESRLLVTTRFAEVAKIVGTKEYFGLEYIELKGLEPETFWDLLKSCVSGSENYPINPQLEQIGKSIAPKLDGSPLAARTIGRLLRKSLTIEHWNEILNSELWQLPQKETEILPALWLSYIYLPFHLKRCFSFCAVYPKDYNFYKASLAEIWVAEGFVESQGNIPLQHIGGQYFDDLVNLSFFQKLRGKYVMHDLMHDMAQLVSKNECFIVKKPSDIGKVPQNVLHLSILCDLNFYDLTGLSKHEKLRTLLRKKSSHNDSLALVLRHWFNELKCLRVISSSFTWIPENINNLKHLRYLKIHGACSNQGLPSSFWCLYNLQILYAAECLFETSPTGLYKLINLQKFEAKFQKNKMEIDALEYQKFLKSLNNRCIKKFIGARAWNFLDCLSLRWSSSEEHEIEVLHALDPRADIKSLHLKGYPGEYLPWGSHACNLPTSVSPLFGGSDGPDENINQNEAPGSNNGRTGSIWSSLRKLHIEGSEQLSSLEQFLQPDCVPAIRKIVFENCPRLSLQSSKVGDLSFLEKLRVCDCKNIIVQGFFSPYLKELTLKESRNLRCNLLAVLDIGTWSLPALLELTIIGLNSLKFSGKANHSPHSGSNRSTGTLSSLTVLNIQSCSNLKNIDGLLSHECLPAIRKIGIRYCAELRSLLDERFEGLSSLKDLEIVDCPHLNWQSGMLLPSSLERLSLHCCGDVSSWFPRCLDNLTSLKSLEIARCERIVSIPGHLWRRNLPSLTTLKIIGCPDLVSIGGSNAIAHLFWVSIYSCMKMEEIDQPFEKYDQWKRERKQIKSSLKIKLKRPVI